MPHIKYCNIFWGNTYKSNVSCIYILQKRMIRIICKKKILHHTSGLFIDNSLLKINEITYISIYVNLCLKFSMIFILIYQMHFFL